MKQSPFAKPAPTDQPIHDLLRYRWSPRSFADTPISDEQMRVLFEAARWSASCFNDQPWYFVVAEKKNQDEFQALLDCLMPTNKEWASTAPVLLLSVARTRFAHNDTENRHAFHDVGIATADMTFQATSMGIGMRQMGGFFPEKAREAFAIPDEFEPVAACALGFPDDPQKLAAETAEKDGQPRARKSVSSFVFQGGWGQARYEE